VGDPRQHETERIAAIVTGVRNQRDRMRRQAVDDLGDDQRHVERGRTEERGIEIFGDMGMVVTMVVRVGVRHDNVFPWRIAFRCGGCEVRASIAAGPRV